ncbi:hypothetical protein LOD99_2776 [Oopsacas minuta]|uniref:L-2-hydroxyglutarate dehydrogenase, mitochondrial n=1 Tax=Oopsacas minuta TaxID=111878 RepID=A0AAV7K178_9METZ|nr:hypothetical protein LOD99_2776 [Oopsacas minuta]
MYGTRSIAKLYDVIIVGGGIVGVATGRQLKRVYPDMRVAILEKEHSLGLHQTGRNSGVIHAGIYYKPGSMMAKLCVEGSDMTYKYLRERGIRHKQCGKVIVARWEGELDRLEQLFSRAVANGVRNVRMIDREELREIEPSCQGLRAIYSPHTGIVNYREMTQSMGQDFLEMGGDIILKREVTGFQKGKVLTKEGTINTEYVIVCGGSQADRLASKRDIRVIPIRGEYLLLNPEKAKLIRGNIYPVPDTDLSFLGVHFTPRLDGTVWVGPTAVLALSREGDTRTSLNITDFKDIITHPGFYRLTAMHWRFAISSLNSILKPIDMFTLNSYIPELVAGDLKRIIRGSGVRALLVDREGNKVEDFYYEWRGDKALHIMNAPSPAATSSLAIAQLIVETATAGFHW